MREESGKAGLKLNTQKKTKHEEHGTESHQFMTNRRGKVEAVTDFIFLSYKITADGECSHEVKRRLLFGGKAMINLDY